MGKLVITPDRNKCVYQDFESLKISRTVEGDFGSIVVYQKIRIETHNYAELGNDWAIGTGTFVFEQKKDDDALLAVLKYISTNEQIDMAHKIWSLRNRILGSYSIVMSVCGHIYVFTDNLGTYNIYYLINDKGCYLTNTWYHVNKFAGNNCDLDKMLFSEYFNKIDNLFDRTPYKDIVRLDEYHYLEFFENSWKVNNWNARCAETRIDFWDKLIEDYKILTRVFGTHGISYTGGLDSRMNLALLLGVNAKPKLFYGIGNTRETNTKEGDLLVVKQTAERYGLELKTMNWNDDGNNHIESNMNLYGEMSILYASNDNIFDEYYGNIDVDCMLYGYHGEYLRNNEYIADEFFDLDWYINTYIDNAFVSSLTDKHGYLTDVKNLLTNFCELNGINPTKISRNDILLLNYSVRQGPSSRMCNFTNLFTYSYMMMPNADLIHTANEVSYERRAEGKFMIKGIHNIFPDCLEIPLFSHHVLRSIDLETFEMKNAQERVEGIREYLRPFYSLLKDTFIRKLYFILKGDKKGLAELVSEEQLWKDHQDVLNSPFLCDIYDNSKLQKALDGSFLALLFLSLKLVGEVE